MMFNSVLLKIANIVSHPSVRWIFRILLLMLGVIFLVLATMQSAPTLIYSPIADKIQHAFAMFSLAVVSHLAFPKQKMIVRILCVIAYGIIIELAQSTLPYRTSSWTDVAANLTGLIAYWVLIKAIQIMIKESRLQTNSNVSV
ncbi:MAG: VanZ family protein [Pseudomonadota bacterium]